MGEVTLVGGQATVPLRRITENAVVQLQPKVPSGSTGMLKYSINPNSGFVITSTSVLDASVVTWAVFV